MVSWPVAVIGRDSSVSALADLSPRSREPDATARGTRTTGRLGQVGRIRAALVSAH